MSLLAWRECVVRVCEPAEEGRLPFGVVVVETDARDSMSKYCWDTSRWCADWHW